MLLNVTEWLVMYVGYLNIDIVTLLKCHNSYKITNETIEIYDFVRFVVVVREKKGVFVVLYEGEVLN